MCTSLPRGERRCKENRAAEKKEQALAMSRASLFDLLHAQAAIAALG